METRVLLEEEHVRGHRPARAAQGHFACGLPGGRALLRCHGGSLPVGAGLLKPALVWRSPRSERNARTEQAARRGGGGARPIRIQLATPSRGLAVVRARAGFTAATRCCTFFGRAAAAPHVCAHQLPTDRVPERCRTSTRRR